jgi:hypothetical protein
MMVAVGQPDQDPAARAAIEELIELGSPLMDRPLDGRARVISGQVTWSGSCMGAFLLATQSKSLPLFPEGQELIRFRRCSRMDSRDWDSNGRSLRLLGRRDIEGALLDLF